MPTGDPTMWSQRESQPVGMLSDSIELVPSAVAILPGALAVESPREDFLLEGSYCPESVSELVSRTPSEVVRMTSLELDPRLIQVNGKVIEPLPLDMKWFQGASLRSDVFYTAVRQVVRAELEHFAAELDKHFTFIPKTNG